MPFVLHAVRGAVKRRNISNGRVIELNLLQNRRMIAICVRLGVTFCYVRFDCGMPSVLV